MSTTPVPNDSALDVRPTTWLSGLWRWSVRRTGSTTWGLLIIAVLAMAAAPAVWACIVVPLMVAATVIEWLVNNERFFDRHHLLAFVVGAGSVLWIAAIGAGIGVTLARRRAAGADVAEVADATANDAGEVDEDSM